MREELRRDRRRKQTLVGAGDRAPNGRTARLAHGGKFRNRRTRRRRTKQRLTPARRFAFRARPSTRIEIFLFDDARRLVDGRNRTFDRVRRTRKQLKAKILPVVRRAAGAQRIFHIRRGKSRRLRIAPAGIMCGDRLRVAVFVGMRQATGIAFLVQQNAVRGDRRPGGLIRTD